MKRHESIDRGTLRQENFFIEEKQAYGNNHVFIFRTRKEKALYGLIDMVRGFLG